MNPGATPERWSGRQKLALGIVVIGGIIIRVVFFPFPNHGDMDQFVRWVSYIANNGFQNAYQATGPYPVTFGPVMVYLWAILAAIDPGFATAIDASDPGLRTLMRIPPTIADFGLAALIAYALWDRPRWAIAGAALTLLILPTWYVSAWWGQYESIFVLSGLGAAIAAMRGHNLVAAALIAVSLATKPQAIPFIVPFAAWFWATGYGRDRVRGAITELAKTAAVGLAVLVVLWGAFIPAGGPLDYLSTMRFYQDVYAIQSLRAWNVWWLFQEAVLGGDFARDDTALIGPITFRAIGLAVTAAMSIAIAIAIIRDRRPGTLLTGLAASVLVFFTFMTQMHERYAYAAILFLILAIPTRVSPWLWVVFVVTLSLNIVAAVPITEEVGALVPINGPLGIAGSFVLIGVTVAVIAATRHPRDLQTATGPSGAGPPPIGEASSGT
jgi:Gpi18-like mannosyltransferase